MRKLLSAFFVSFPVLLLGTEAQAQAPAPVPEVMPFDIPFGPPITIEHAKEVAAAAVAEAKKHNWKMAITIVEPTGDMIYFEKIDGTSQQDGVVSKAGADTVK
jgi:glc operon protein GlcG